MLLEDPVQFHSHDKSYAAAVLLIKDDTVNQWDLAITMLRDTDMVKFFNGGSNVNTPVV